MIVSLHAATLIWDIARGSRGMARNLIQFQKGLAEVRVRALYGDETACWRQVVEWRWRKGLVVIYAQDANTAANM